MCGRFISKDWCMTRDVIVGHKLGHIDAKWGKFGTFKHIRTVSSTFGLIGVRLAPNMTYLELF